MTLIFAQIGTFSDFLVKFFVIISKRGGGRVACFRMVLLVAHEQNFQVHAYKVYEYKEPRARRGSYLPFMGGVFSRTVVTAGGISAFREWLAQG